MSVGGKYSCSTVCDYQSLSKPKESDSESPAIMQIATSEKNLFQPYQPYPLDKKLKKISPNHANNPPKIKNGQNLFQSCKQSPTGKKN